MKVVKFPELRYSIIHALGERIAADVTWEEFLHLCETIDVDSSSESLDIDVSDYDGEKIITILKYMTTEELDMAQMWAKVKLFSKRNPDVFKPFLCDVLSDETKQELPGVYVREKKKILEFPIERSRSRSVVKKKIEEIENKEKKKGFIDKMVEFGRELLKKNNDDDNGPAAA